MGCDRYCLHCSVEAVGLPNLCIVLLGGELAAVMCFIKHWTSLWDVCFRLERRMEFLQLCPKEASFVVWNVVFAASLVEGAAE